MRSGSRAIVSKIFLLAATFALVKAGSNSFYYNGDAECSYPFSSFSITGISCMTSSAYTYVSGYNDNDSSDFSDDESICTFGDTMNIVGSATMDGMSVKKFSIILQVCYGGSAYRGYNPITCRSHRTNLDLTDYLRLSEAEYYDEELDESDYYLQPGQYQWRAGFQIPKKSFYFSTGSSVTVHMKLIPYESYPDYPYYGSYLAGKSYSSDITDSKTKSQCFASFTAIPDENENGVYYQAVAASIFLLGVATFVTVKRKVICARCLPKDDNDDSKDETTKYIRQGVEESSIMTL